MSSQFKVKGSVNIMDVRTSRLVKSVPFDFSQSDGTIYAEKLTYQKPYNSDDAEASDLYPSHIKELERGRQSVISIETFADRAVVDIAAQSIQAVLDSVDREGAKGR